MKKFLFITILCLGFVSGNAQRFKPGLKAGLNNTNLTGDANTDAKIGFYVGGLVDFLISDKFHVQPELMYSSEGADDDAGISYLRLPIMGKYYINENFNLQAGPEIAFKVGTEEEVIDEATTSTDFALGLGAAYELETGLFFDARYNLGLGNISDVDGLDFGNTGFQIGLGYRF